MFHNLTCNTSCVEDVACRCDHDHLQGRETMQQSKAIDFIKPAGAIMLF